MNGNLLSTVELGYGAIAAAAFLYIVAGIFAEAGKEAVDTFASKPALFIIRLVTFILAASIVGAIVYFAWPVTGLIPKDNITLASLCFIAFYGFAIVLLARLCKVIEGLLTTLYVGRS